MKEKFKIGDKVRIPKTKSISSNYDESNAIEYAKINGLKFLYINNIYSDGLRCSLWYEKNNFGDLFLLSELEPYEEELQYEIY